MDKYIFCMLIMIACTGCFRRWVMTDKQIAAYYKDKPIKPVFFTISNDSVRLFCAATGNDTLPPLIMIHGAPGAWYGSRNLMEDTVLQNNFHIIAVDRLGYNKSRFRNRRSAVNSIELQATAIHEAFRLNRSFKTGVVMGSSYGAPIAAKMAIMYPEKFHHVMMLAPAIDPDLEKFWWFHRYLRSGLIMQFLPMYLRNATLEKFGHVEELKKLSGEWKNLRTPVTVIQGGRDYIIRPENLEYARMVLRDKKAKFIYLPEAGHVIRWQYPDTIRTLLLSTSGEVRPL